MAVLYRMNALSRGIEQALLEKGISYRVIRGLAFYERLEVKDVLSMLRLAVNPRDSISLARVANVPVRGVGKKSVELLSEQLQKTAGIDAADVWKEIAETGGGLKGKSGSGVKELAKNMLQILELSSDVHEAVRSVLYPRATRNTLRPTTLKTGRSGSRTFLKYSPWSRRKGISPRYSQRYPSSPIRTQGTILRTGSTSSRSMLQRDSSSPSYS